MKNTILKDILKTGIGGIVGIMGHRKNTEAEAIAQQQRYNKTELIYESLKELRARLDSCFQIIDKSNDNIQIPKELGDKVKAKAYEIEDVVDKINQVSECNNENFVEEVETANRVSIEFKDLIDNMFNGNNNFLPDFNFIPFYDFLDSLTLLEESALLHILMFILILSCVVSITSVFFGNEVIKYFKLEERFPRLGLFFKLRATFQRYYLMWNITIIVAVSFFAIFLNLLVFYTK